MLDQHAAFRQELHLAARFFHKVNKHRDQMPDAAGGPAENEHILQHVSLAFEDIPEDMHESVRTLLMHPTEDKSLRQHVIDVAKNAAGGGWGEIEQVTNKLTCLHILSHLGHHAPYTYRVDSKVIRGSRPTPDKLKRLNAAGCGATVNLCKEMTNGDAELIDAAGLTGEMQTLHISITDNTPPDHGQVDELITYLESSPGRVYVHCEAGVGRTGVMVACYRMFQGWPLADALCEAKQFGCSMPDQLAFIENQASAPRSARPSQDDQPTEEKLRETAPMNKDPVGLDRALASSPIAPDPNTTGQQAQLPDASLQGH